MVQKESQLKNEVEELKVKCPVTTEMQQKIVLKHRFVTMGYIYYESTMQCFANHLKNAESLKAKCF